jgi:hypothetical protein
MELKEYICYSMVSVLENELDEFTVPIFVINSTNPLFLNVGFAWILKDQPYDLTDKQL